MTADSVAELGQKILSMERGFNARAGFTSEHDRLPYFLTTETVAPHNIDFQVTDEELDSVFNFVKEPIAP